MGNLLSKSNLAVFFFRVTAGSLNPTAHFSVLEAGPTQHGRIQTRRMYRMYRLFTVPYNTAYHKAHCCHKYILLISRGYSWLQFTVYPAGDCMCYPVIPSIQFMQSWFSLKSCVPASFICSLPSSIEAISGDTRERSHSPICPIPS